MTPCGSAGRPARPARTARTSLARALVACQSRVLAARRVEDTLEASAHDSDAAAAQPLEAALARLEQSVGDPEFVGELIGDFLAGLPGQLAALRAAHAVADSEQVHRIAHTLKSNAGTFGADDLALACRALEQAAADGEAGTQELIERVEAEAGRAAPALASARDQRLP